MMGRTRRTYWASRSMSSVCSGTFARRVRAEVDKGERVREQGRSAGRRAYARFIDVCRDPHRQPKQPRCARLALPKVPVVVILAIGLPVADDQKRDAVMRATSRHSRAKEGGAMLYVDWPLSGSRGVRMLTSEVHIRVEYSIELVS